MASQNHPYDLSAFPKVVQLRDGSRAMLRLMTSADGRQLHEFFLRIPQEDRRYLKDDVTSRELIERWTRELDYARVLPLLCEIDGILVSDASLHRSRDPNRPNAAEVRIVVDPAVRNKGLARQMLIELIALARQRDLEHIFFELAPSGEAAAVRQAERLGFVGIAQFFHQRRDQLGEFMDVLVLEFRLREFGNRE